MRTKRRVLVIVAMVFSAAAVGRGQESVPAEVEKLYALGNKVPDEGNLDLAIN